MDTNQTLYRILIADNNTGFSTILTHRLGTHPDFSVLAVVGAGEEAIMCVERLKPDVILLDIELSTSKAYGLIQALKRSAPSSRIITLSLVPNAVYEAECMQAGSSAHLLKDGPVDTLVAAIRDRGVAGDGDPHAERSGERHGDDDRGEDPGGTRRQA